ncbi:MAG: hypothetical protein ACT4O0_06640 [Pseudonocardia sp.]
MELLIDISRKSFSVGRPFERKLDDNGVQRLDRKTRAPLWAAQLVVMDERGADTIVVTIAGDPPSLQQGQPVTPMQLVAIPWNRNGREGIAYRAIEVRPVAVAKAS